MDSLNQPALLQRPNLLGDYHAEADHEMLSRAFIETVDYRTLLETSDKTLVVGRRGTGKSALALQLLKVFNSEPNVSVLTVMPEQEQVIGMRPLVRMFGNTFNMITAGAKLGWRYALMMEAILALSSNYKYSKTTEHTFLNKTLTNWTASDMDITEKLRFRLKEVVNQTTAAEEIISDLPRILDLKHIEQSLISACTEMKHSIVFIFDRLDEGYEPDDIGIGFINGLVHAAIDLKTRIHNIKSIIFIRDNIFRAVQKLDADFTRNIEGNVLRLHWDEGSLLNFSTRRLKVALDIKSDASIKIWNQCTKDELKGTVGFSKCLHMTLYRPRDVIALLNEAFYNANRLGQSGVIGIENIEISAKYISENRLEDLKREYTATLPGLPLYVSIFHNKNPRLELSTFNKLIEDMFSRGSENPIVQQDLNILGDSNAIIRALSSVGFLGVLDNVSGRFIFCHDGRAPDREFNIGDELLVHPCYWMALNCTSSTLAVSEAEEIYDEYDIEIFSETPQIRIARINAIIKALDDIPEGDQGSHDFENWSHKAIRICFAKGLKNIELKPNKNAQTRRDIVGTNLCLSGFWKRIYGDYKARQVLFEVKNYRELTSSDYYQMQAYLVHEYGRFGIFVTRSDNVELYAGKDVEWVRSVYLKEEKLILKITAKYLCNLLDKLKKPLKHDQVDDALHILLDDYIRLYIEGQTKSNKTKKRIIRP